MLTVTPEGGLAAPANVGAPPYIWLPETAMSKGPWVTVKSLAVLV